MKTKLLMFLIGFGLSVLPSMAKIDGGVSKNHFYDTEKTLMDEVSTDKAIKTEAYWGKNLFYFNKYRPIFMLSNKELYDLMPREPVSVVQRISTPSVYTISLKSPTINKISLNQSVERKVVTEQKKPVEIIKASQKDKYLTIYEQAKNPETEPEMKLEAAVALKNSKNVSNYAHAIDLLSDVIAKEPYNAYAFYLKGELYSAKKDSQNAMKNYIEALKINPTSKQCCLGIAKILEPTNKQLAQKYYDKAK